MPVMWFSILGALPFTLVLPHVGLSGPASWPSSSALIMASAFSAILVYAQELMPGRVGLVAGMFFGFSFGLGGLGAAALGQLADRTSIEHRLSGLRLPAGARAADGLPAEAARPRGLAADLAAALAGDGDHRRPRRHAVGSKSGQRVEGRSKLLPGSSPGCWMARNIVSPSGVKRGPQTSAPVGAW